MQACALLDGRLIATLTRLVNHSLRAGHFPDQALASKIYAHYKGKGLRRSFAKNYAPLRGAHFGRRTKLMRRQLFLLLSRKTWKRFTDLKKMLRKKHTKRILDFSTCGIRCPPFAARGFCHGAENRY